MLPKRGQPKYPCRLVSSDDLYVLYSGDDAILNLIEYP
jgi:hypothetical protein